MLLGESPHPAAVAYRKKRSIADHVWPHAGAELLVTADVADFFPATAAGRTRDPSARTRMLSCRSAMPR